MDPDPTRACFWNKINKSLTRLWSGYFFVPTRWDFVWPEGKKMEKYGIFRGNFSNLNQRWLTRPNPSNKKLTRPGSKFFDLVPSLVAMLEHHMHGYLFTLIKIYICLFRYMINIEYLCLSMLGRWNSGSTNHLGLSCSWQKMWFIL